MNEKNGELVGVGKGIDKTIINKHDEMVWPHKKEWVERMESELIGENGR